MALNTELFNQTGHVFIMSRTRFRGNVHYQILDTDNYSQQSFIIWPV